MFCISTFSFCNTNNITSSVRDLNEFETFIRHDKAVQIIHKIALHKEKTLDCVVFSRRPFGIGSNEPGREAQFKESIKVFGSQGYSFLPISSVTNNQELIGKWKVIMSKTSAEHAGQSDKEGKKRIVSRILVLDPGVVCTESYLLLSAFDTQAEADNMVSYVKTRFFRFLMSTILLTQNIAKDKFVFVPLQDFSKPWTDAELYQKYHLTQDEINYIESIIKPMADDALFDADEYVDPAFADFDLVECGVEPGDRIVYTPTGAVLTVKGDHEVEYEGETYTLAQFTAKFMPRNKRSVSGVCQGPKYFTKGGTSLYKMRESFLGGKKTK